MRRAIVESFRPSISRKRSFGAKYGVAPVNPEEITSHAQWKELEERAKATVTDMSASDKLNVFLDSAAILADEGFNYMDAPIMRVAGPDVPGVPYSRPLQEWFMPNPQKIAEAMRRLARY